MNGESRLDLQPGQLLETADGVALGIPLGAHPQPVSFTVRRSCLPQVPMRAGAQLAGKVFEISADQRIRAESGAFTLGLRVPPGIEPEVAEIAVLAPAGTTLDAPPVAMWLHLPASYHAPRGLLITSMRSVGPKGSIYALVHSSPMSVPVAPVDVPSCEEAPSPVEAKLRAISDQLTRCVRRLPHDWASRTNLEEMALTHRYDVEHLEAVLALCRDLTAQFLRSRVELCARRLAGERAKTPPPRWRRRLAAVGDDFDRLEKLFDQCQQSLPLRRRLPALGHTPNPDTCAPPPGAQGNLLLRSETRASIYRGARLLGRVPIRVTLPAGCHILGLRADRPSRTKYIEVVVTPDSETRLVVPAW